MRGLIVAALATGIGVAQSAAKAGLPAPAAEQPASAAAGNWPAGGRDQQGTYYSPLTQINSKNIDQLGFAWSYDLGTYRGQEATPIVIDGVMYTSGTWGYVYAVNAATGKELWKFDPRADPRAARNPSRGG